MPLIFGQHNKLSHELGHPVCVAEKQACVSSCINTHGYACCAVVCMCRQLHVELGGSTVLDQRCLLVLLLVLERCKGSTSAFAPYIDMLPTSYGTRQVHVWGCHSASIAIAYSIYAAVKQTGNRLQRCSCC